MKKMLQTSEEENKTHAKKKHHIMQHLHCKTKAKHKQRDYMNILMGFGFSFV
jgi:hypothetical protein